MAKRKHPPQGARLAPQQQISMADTEQFVCEDCNNAVFIPAFFLRRLSPLMSPSGKEAMIPVQVYSCGNCGKVPTSLMQEVNG